MSSTIIEKSTGFKPYTTNKPSDVEWLGEIPAHWEVRRLRSTVLSHQNGVWGTEPNGSNEIACMRVADFDRVRFRASIAKPTLRSVDPDVISTRKLLPGDLLLEVSGGGEKQPVGAVVLYDNKQPAVCSNFIAQLRPSEGFESRFLTYLHSALYSARVNVRSIKQSIGIQNLDKASYLNEAAGFPPLTEQRAIAAFLDRETARIDALVAKKERLIELLQEKRTAVISRAVTKGLDPDVPMKDSGVEWLRRIPAHWHFQPLWTMFRRLKRTGHEDRELLSVYRDHGVIPKSSRDDNFNRPSEDLSTYQLVQPSDLVINKMKAWQGSIAISEHSGIVSPAYHVYVGSHCNTDHYLHHLFRSGPYISAYQRISKGIRTNQWDLEPEPFSRIEVLLPPLVEQRAIAAFLDRETAKLDALTTKIHEAINHLRELRAALISEAVMGRIDVREEAA